MKVLQLEVPSRHGYMLRGILNIADETKPTAFVLNLHGFGGSRSGYKYAHTHMARMLAQNGISSARFDFYGCGESDGEFENMTFTSTLEDAEDLYNWLKLQPFADANRIILSGQSMGGMVAASAAPIVQPCALVLMCPGAGMWYGCKERADEMTAKNIKYADVEGLRFATDFNYDLAKYNPFEDAKGFDGKTVIIRGTEDKLVDEGTCRKYMEVYKDCQYVEISGGNHNFSTIPTRDACEDAVLSFCKQFI
ncbi:MAG: alpha/beta fold hydrolase [Oscillospiraceae bacterium]